VGWMDFQGRIGTADDHADRRRSRSKQQETRVSEFLYDATPFMVGAVFIVLLFGLVNMMRGGSPNVSQKLMRLRVILQFLVIVVVVLVAWLVKH
jgi:hypothetical protein